VVRGRSGEGEAEGEAGFGGGEGDVRWVGERACDLTFTRVSLVAATWCCTCPWLLQPGDAHAPRVITSEGWLSFTRLQYPEESCSNGEKTAGSIRPVAGGRL
jgi:hypothetical protein